jgi:hypothetical protein
MTTTVDLSTHATYVGEVIADKGFHAIEHTDKEALTFRQISHLMSEWTEAYEIWSALRSGTIPTAQRETAAYDMAVELIDIVIVALDLAWLNEIDVGNLAIDYYFVQETEWVNLAQNIGALANAYRKQYILKPGILQHIIEQAWTLCRRVGYDPEAVFQQKMIINASRPARYNTPHEG